MKFIYALAVALTICSGAMAQTAQTAVQYMQQIDKVQTELSQKYISYMSAASHRRNIKKVEKKRDQLVNSINDARMAINQLPSYNGDKSIRDSAVNYMKVLYRVFNEDYAKLVNMEEIAEQSYDLMEAYLLMQQKAGEKLREASDNLVTTQKTFAQNNNINLIQTTSELGQKLETIGNVQAYYNEVYLVFFKPYKQELFYLDALQAKNTNAMEQNRNALARYAQEGLENLKTMKGYNSDKSVENACRKLLEFYADEAEKHFTIMTEFIIKAENFEKLKAAFESSSKNKQEVDRFNKAVDDINKSADQYNKLNHKLNQQRGELIDNYERAVSNFMDTHMPYAR